jgi:hypothetical protein
MTVVATIQTDFWGNEVVAGNVVDRLTHLLETCPDTRESYMTLIARYWLTYDGLAAILALPMQPHEFLAWFEQAATSPKTLQNRTMEIQRRRPHLDASPGVRKKRQAMAKAGPVR